MCIGHLAELAESHRLSSTAESVQGEDGWVSNRGDSVSTDDGDPLTASTARRMQTADYKRSLVRQRRHAISYEGDASIQLCRYLSNVSLRPDARRHCSVA